MYAIGTVTKGTGDDAHYRLLAQIKTVAEAVGWTTLRYDTVSAERELILHSTGTSGDESIHVGFKCYQNAGADFYNIIAATMVGFLSASAFESQPGFRGSGLPAHNLACSYYITANKRRIVGGLKVGTPVFTHFYVGKFLPYARPGEYPSPLAAAGHFDGREARRFSETQWFPYKGVRGSSDSGYNDGNLYIRDQAGAWKRVRVSPFSNAAGTSTSSFALAGDYVGGTTADRRALVPANADPAQPRYQPQPLVLYELSFGAFNTTTQSFPATGNVFGELDGVFQISGFGATAEAVLQVGGSSTVDQTGLTVLQAVDAIRAVGGRAFVVLQDWSRNSWRDFIALEMS